jgi:hypothetical protein
MQPGMYVSAGPLDSGLTPFPQFSRPIGGDSSSVDSRQAALNEAYAAIQGCKTPLNKRTSVGHTLPVTDRSSRSIDGSVPRGSSQHRQESGRSPALSGSPMSSDQYMDALGADLSRLLVKFPDVHGPSRPSTRKVEAVPQEVDLRRAVLTNNRGRPVPKSKAVGIGHDRKITDPFVEHIKDKSPAPSPFLTQAAQKVEPFRALQVPYSGTPGSQVPSSSTTQKDHGFTNAHGIRSPGTPVSQHYQPSTPKTPSFQKSTAGPRHTNLPNPPPLLSSTHGLRHKPETRARLDARAAVRAEWIRTEAKKIADLSRLTYAAAHQYELTGTKEDYEEWQRLAAALSDATNLEKRQEERRNLFMPKGMRAMRTGPENKAGDQSASFPASNGEKKEEGHLLGFQMAYMERVCAEVKREADEKKEAETEAKAEAEDCQISPEMMATLTNDERKELKKLLSARAEAKSGRKD